jgi:CheY-like chemotaxis protein
MKIIPNLLVTDDDSAFRDALCEGLSRWGFRVAAARDGEEAIEKLSRTQFHFAIVDFHMPRLSGLEVIRHLTRTPMSPPCVLMSAKLDDEIRREAREMNAYQVLSKPVRLVQLNQLIRGALADVYGWLPEDLPQRRPAAENN